MSGNVLFMVDNMLDRAASLTASSEVATLPVSNLQEHQRSVVWRTDGNPGGSEYVDIVLDATEEAVSGAALVDHNLSLGGSIRVQAWTDAIAGASQVVDQTIQPYQSVNGYGTQAYGEGPYGGYEPLGPFSAYIPRTYLRVVSFLHLAAPVAALYWRITLNDASNYIQCGRIYIGQVWQPSVNFSYGARLSRQSRTHQVEAAGGQRYGNRRAGRMELELPLDWLDTTGQQLLWASFLHVEDHTPIVVVAKPAATSFDRELRSIYGTFDRLSVESAFHDNFRSPIRLIEAL